MSKRRISEEKIREMQMKSGGRGPGSRFGGLREKPKNIKGTIMNDFEWYVKWKWVAILLVILLVMALLMHP